MRKATVLRILISAAATLFGGGGVSAQELSAATMVHVEAARSAAGEHAGMVERLCPMPGPRPAGPARRGVRAVPPRSEWHAEPVRVFDNLAYVGMTEFSTWAVTTSEGIIIIDPIFDYSVEDEVVEGLRKLGLDPADIRYVIASHGHYDHVGGAKFLQDAFGARVLLSAADWDLLEENGATWVPRRDIEVTDGQKLTLGDTTLEMYLTPGHTDGTISTLIPLKDGGADHVAALWGGTLFNFGPQPDRFRAYADSAERFLEIAVAAGADVLLSNHTDYDGSKEKLPRMAARRAGDPHPYVVGTDSIRRYLSVAHECALAALADFQ
ncbi:MAG: MBL fold metallo-hydrolase [Gammaproteobacteria bacterium]|jgi:metallo-beta-lactamase class B